MLALELIWLPPHVDMSGLAFHLSDPMELGEDNTFKGPW